MKVFVGSVGAGVVSGLIAYAAIRVLLPELAGSDLMHLIGLLAVVGGLVTAWVARRLGQEGGEG